MTILDYLGVDPDAGLFTTGNLVHLAMLGYVVGFVLKNQIALRLLVLAATFLYIAYYYYHPAEPLWGAIFASLMILAANLTGLGRILYGRLRIAIPPDQLAIFDAMARLHPGEFRRLMRLGAVRKADEETLLTTEGETPGRIFFVSEGETTATKSGESFRIPAKHFIGEVGFVLGAPASASVTVSKGAVFVEWDKARLRAALVRNAELERAFEALLSQDMAVKVAAGVQFDDMRAKPGEDRPWTALAAALSIAPGGAGGPIRAGA